MSELRNEVVCSIIKFEPDGSNDIMNLTNTLLTKGEFIKFVLISSSLKVIGLNNFLSVDLSLKWL